jgi:hypothetical protein
MIKKIASILSIAGLTVAAMTSLSTPAAAQSTQACRDACKALYPDGRSDPEYLDCVEICSQANPTPPNHDPDCSYGRCYYDNKQSSTVVFPH